MKKRISVILAIVVGISCVTGVLSASNDTEAPTEIEAGLDDINLSARTAFELGIISRDYFDKLNLSDIVSRAEFAQMLYSIIAAKQEVKSVNSSSDCFSDVSRYHYAATEIGALASMGIINGQGDGSFLPEQSITGEEALIILLNTAGYKSLLKQTDFSFETFSRECGLWKYITQDTKQFLTRESVATLLGNFLYLDTLKMEISDASFGGESILKVYLDAEYYDEVIEAANGVSLYREYYDKNSLQIHNKSYSADGEKDYSNYVGMKARVFISGDNVIGVVVLNNKTLIIDAQDITDFQNNVYYYDENGKNRKARVDKKYDLLINNAYSSDVSQMIPNSGYITLIDNNNDTSYDIVRIDSYSAYVVDKVILDDNTIIMKNTDSEGKQISCNLDDWSEYQIINTNNAESDLSEIVEGMVVSLAPAGKERITIYTSPDKVKGKVRKNDDDKYSIDDKIYQMIRNPYLNGWKGTEGIQITFLLDRFGKIAGVEGFNHGEWRYAVILRCFERDDDNVLCFKLLDEDGQIKTIDADSKLGIDNEIFSSVSAALAKINENYSQFEKLKPGVVSAEETDNQVYDRISTRLVRYYVSAEGKIKRIDTPLYNSKYEQDKNLMLDDKDCLMISAKGRLHYAKAFPYMLRVPYDSYSEIPGEIVSGSNTKVFVLPSELDELNDPTAMGVYNSLSAAGCVDNKYYAASGYNIKSGTITDDVVVLAKNSGETSSGLNVGLYQQTKQVLNDDDEVKEVLCGVFEGEETSYEISDKNTFDVSKLQTGDILLYSLSNGKIRIDSIGFRVSDLSGTLTAEPRYVTLPGESHYFAKGRIILAQVERVEDGVGVLRYFDEKYPNEIMPNLKKSFMYSVENDREFNQVDISSVKTYDVFGDKADYIIIYQKEGVIYSQYIIRK